MPIDIVLPRLNSYEKYYINFYGVGAIKNIILEIYRPTAFDLFKTDYLKHSQGKDISEQEFLNKFIDSKNKVKFAEKIALYVIKNELEVPDVIKSIIDKAVGETING